MGDHDFRKTNIVKTVKKKRVAMKTLVKIILVVQVKKILVAEKNLKQVIMVKLQCAQ